VAAARGVDVIALGAQAAANTVRLFGLSLSSRSDS
jgi:hypothetical protein